MLIHRHPAGGYLELTNGGGVVTLHCHWPFDLENDEWIDIENSYGTVDFLAAVENAMVHRKGTIRGIVGGFLEVTPLPEGFDVGFSRPQDGWSASSFHLHIGQPVSDLRRSVWPRSLAAEGLAC